MPGSEPEEAVMQYALLIYQVDKEWAEADEAERARMYAEHGKFAELLNKHDAMRGGAELALSANATTVRKTGGDALLTDGPYAETTEQIGGYYIVEAKDLDQALEFAKACPADIVEVRPFAPSPEPA
jgi:hypothetical protein